MWAAAGDFNPYRYCGDGPTAHLDPSGTNEYDAVDKWWNNGRLPKAWGVDVTGSAVIGAGVTAALQLVFFGDTCEFGLYGVAPGAAKPPEKDQVKAGGEAVKSAAEKFFLDLPWGWDVSGSANITIASRSGDAPAGAQSWEGIFYGGTFGGSFLGKLGVGGFVGENIKTGDWVGGSIGAGVSVTPGLNAKTNPQYYYLIAGIKLSDILGDTLGTCACYALIRKML
jgi:hypothetical protein